MPSRRHRPKLDTILKHAGVEDPDHVLVGDRVFQNKIRLAVAQKVSHSRNVPARGSSWQTHRRRVNPAVLCNPAHPLTADGILQDQVREAITVEVSSSYHMPTRRDRGKLDTELQKAVDEDPDHVLAGNRILQNEIRLAVTEKISDSGDVPARGGS